MSTVPELQTERLLMRGWRDQDFEPWAAILGDPAVARGLGHDAGLTPFEAWRDLALMAGHWALKGYGNWVLEERHSGELVGRAGLYYPPDWPELEVGWTVAREHWGKGYALEAGRAAVAWATEQLGLRHIVSLIHASNEQSIRVAEKLGEKLEGHHKVRGFDLLVYGTDLPLRDDAVEPRRGSPAPRAGYRARMTTFEDTPDDPLVRQEEEAAAAEAAGIGGRAPEYEDEEGDAASEADRAVIESGEGVEEGFETAESDLREAASHGENRYDPEERDFGDEESAGEGDAVSGEPDEIDVTETVRDPEAGPGEDPGEGPGISHDR